MTNEQLDKSCDESSENKYNDSQHGKKMIKMSMKNVIVQIKKHSDILNT